MSLVDRKRSLVSCPEEILLERIRKRKRSIEQPITIECLTSLGRSIKRRVSKAAKRVPIIEINSHRIDFAYLTKGKKKAIEQISDTLVTFSRST
jgi:deoxyadenosine/deoxycytidine kinase